jgi:hypothetical protein
MSDDVFSGDEPGEGDPLAAGAAHAGTGETSGGTGGDTPPAADRPAPATDHEPKDAGEPADAIAEPEGTSGAEEGLNPWAPESYTSDPDGPTTSTADG